METAEPTGNATELTEIESINKELYEDSVGITNVDLYITSKCNYRCEDCLAGHIRDKGEKHASKQTVLDMVDAVEGISSVHYAGWGEPFTHPDIFEILDYTAEKVRNKIGINTNGFWVPLDNTRADRVISRLPNKTHIYMSIDDFHEQHDPNAVQRAQMMKAACAKHDIPLTFGIRVLEKSRYKGVEEADKIIDRYDVDDYDIIVNRVIRQGWAKDMDNAHRIDLQILLYNLMYKNDFSILPDGSVVSNFVPAYLPEEYRPRISELGNINEEGLFDIVSKHKGWVEQVRERKEWAREQALASMIDDMDDYPFKVGRRGLFNWYSPYLKPKLKQTELNTAHMLGQRIMTEPLHQNIHFLSDNGVMYREHEQLDECEDEFWWSWWKKAYGDEFGDEDRDTILQLQRLWNLTGSVAISTHYEAEFWDTLSEMNGSDMAETSKNAKKAFRNYLRTVVDTPEKEKVVGYLNRQNNLLGRGGQFWAEFLNYSYQCGKYRKKSDMFESIQVEKGYRSPHANHSLAFGMGNCTLIGVLESLMLYTSISEPVGVPAIVACVAMPIIRPMLYKMGYSSDFRGKVRI